MDQSLRTLIEQAEFKESFRGYDRAQVDDTLEQLATRAGKLETERPRPLVAWPTQRLGSEPKSKQSSRSRRSGDDRNDDWASRSH